MYIGYLKRGAYSESKERYLKNPVDKSYDSTTPLKTPNPLNFFVVIFPTTSSISDFEGPMIKEDAMTKEDVSRTSSERFKALNESNGQFGRNFGRI